MKTLDERITEAQGALEEAKASEDTARQARAEARLETLQEAQEFHNKEFERVGKKIRSEGGEAKEKELLEKYGVSTPEELAEIVADHKAIQDASETETEAERKAREKAEKERDEEIQKRKDSDQRADNILIKSELKASLIGEGARQDRLARLLKEADLSEVEVADDEVKNLEPVIKLLKEEIPEWFGSDEQPAGSRPSSRAAQGPTNQQIDKEAQQAERSRTVSAL